MNASGCSAVKAATFSARAFAVTQCPSSKISKSLTPNVKHDANQ